MNRNEIMGFNGKAEDWMFWRGKFLAHGRRMKFADILRGNVKVESSIEVGLTMEEKVTIDRHDDGFTELVIVMLDKKLSMEVMSCVSKEHPDGDLLMAWELLESKFSPRHSSDMVQLQEELMGCKMGPMETPEEWLTRFEGLQRRLECVFNIT